jgi:hypothetical protein
LIPLLSSPSSPFIPFIPVETKPKDDVEALDQIAPKHPAYSFDGDEGDER